jgi:hypothetical protein
MLVPIFLIGAAKIFAFLELEPRLNKNRFNWAGKNEHFSKVSVDSTFFYSCRFAP